MSHKKVNVAMLRKQFHEAHEIGAKKFGLNWLIANKQAIRACEQVDLDPTSEQMKALLSLAALNILMNTMPRRADAK